MSVSKNQILKKVTDYYLGSSGFNGIPIHTIQQQIDSAWDEAKEYIHELINAELIGIIDSDTDINPHIIRLGFEPKEIQISKLDEADIHACVYPLVNHLDKVVNPDDFRDEPYKLELALGSPQLSHKAFDLSILEYYRNDPRYYYQNNDISGHMHKHTR